MSARDFSVFDTGPWLPGGPERLGPARHVPTMLGYEEELLLHWLGAEWVRGEGAVVDLGPFAGGSTARLAEGLRASGRRAEIHAYDRFGAEDRLKRTMLYPAGIAPFEGRDILPAVETLLADWMDGITLHRGDLREAGWTGDPIEVLVVDASKSTETLDAIARVFYPALRPGSVVVQCGALHWREPWVMAQMVLLRDWLVPLAHVHDTTMVFGCTAPLTAAALEQARTDTLSDAALAAILKSGRAWYEAFGLSDRLEDALAAIVRAPGVREAWKMVPPA
jgi:hypothetical protein